MKFLSLAGLIILLSVACNTASDAPSASETDSSAEAREDSIALANAYAAQAKIPHSVPATGETTAVSGSATDDAADDPAIWVHPIDKSKSLIYGTNKTAGLAAYDLKGNEVAFYRIGRVNNVDVLYGYRMQDSLIDLVGCSNRTDQSLDLFRINPEKGILLDVANDALPMDTSTIDDVYGFCFAKDHIERSYAVVNGKNGTMQQFELVAKDDKISLKLVRTVVFDSQTEGMVADNELGYLYVGEEGRGIWKLPIDPAADTEKILLANSGEENTNITYDVEGLTIYKKDGAGYLIASSQGNFSYAVFERAGENAYLTSFTIVNGINVDGAEETDGVAVVSDSLSPNFPRGLLVVQDGFNHEDSTLVPQNFKYVDWRQISKRVLNKDKD